MRRPPPDFVIVGAPKCGTTSIHVTLQKHPQLFLPSLKEPHYFAYDLPKRREVETLRDYDNLFEPAEAQQLRGETSSLYLSSHPAIGAILERRPDAKFIAMVRNPVDMFISWHNECVKALDEDQADPERAWALQEERAAGRAIPRYCKEPAFLQYRRICGLGSQIEAFYRTVPEHHRLTIVFDELRQTPRLTYERIIRFLRVEDDGTSEFVRENVYARPKSALVARFVRFAFLNAAFRRVRLSCKPFLNRHGIRPMGWLIQHNLEPVAKPALRAEFRRELETAFAPDVIRLEALLGMPLRERWSGGDSRWETAASYCAAAAQCE